MRSIQSHETEVLMEKLKELVAEGRSLINDRVRLLEVVREITYVVQDLTRVSGAARPKWIDDYGNITIDVGDVDEDTYVDTACLSIVPDKIEEWIMKPEEAGKELDEVIKRIRTMALEARELRERAEKVLVVMKAMLELVVGQR